MRDHHQRFLDHGSDLVAIGMGTPEMAAHFRDEERIPFRLLVDRTRETYRALDLRYAGALQIYGPKQVAKSLVNIARGHRLRLARQDFHQLGGALVVAPGGEIVFSQQASDSSDNVAPAELVAAVEKAQSSKIKGSATRRTRRVTRK